MRHTCLAILLSFVATLVAALEVEDHRLFPGTGDRILKVISTADLEVFEPYLRTFQASQPSLSIDYTVVSSTELHRAIRAGAEFDLALSSAMDLQFQLANDGFAQSHRSETTSALPDWARWRDLILKPWKETGEHAPHLSCPPPEFCRDTRVRVGDRGSPPVPRNRRPDAQGHIDCRS